MSVHRRNSGAAIAICGNVEIVSTTPSSRNLKFIFRRASAYAQNAPTRRPRNVTVRLTIALLISERTKSSFWKIDL